MHIVNCLPRSAKRPRGYMAQQEGLRKYWKLNLCLWLILPLRGCEMELAWGFQSKGEVALLVHLGKGFMEREFLSVLHNTHNAQGSLDPFFCVSL